MVGGALGSCAVPGCVLAVTMGLPAMLVDLLSQCWLADLWCLEWLLDHPLLFWGVLCCHLLVWGFLHRLVKWSMPLQL